MKPYEVMVLIHADLEIDLDKPLKKIETLIKDAGGEVSNSDVWGKRKLAYRIKGQDFAVYAYFEVQLPGTGISKLETGLNIADEVLRYLITYPVPKSERDRRRAEGGNDEEEADQDEEETKPTTARSTKVAAARAAAKEK